MPVAQCGSEGTGKGRHATLTTYNPGGWRIVPNTRTANRYLSRKLIRLLTQSSVSRPDIKKHVSRAVFQNQRRFKFPDASKPIRNLSFDAQTEVHVLPRHGTGFFVPRTNPETVSPVRIERPFVILTGRCVKAVYLTCLLFATPAGHLLKPAVQNPFGRRRTRKLSTDERPGRGPHNGVMLPDAKPPIEDLNIRRFLRENRTRRQNHCQYHRGRRYEYRVQFHSFPPSPNRENAYSNQYENKSACLR